MEPDSIRTLIQTMGDLQEFIHRGRWTLNNSNFYAERKGVSDYENYGLNENYHIVITHDNQQQDIIINGITFDYNVYEKLYIPNRNDKTHTYTIRGRFQDGSLFEGKFRQKIFNNDCLRCIVYAMILISELRNVQTAERYWLCVNEESLHNITPSQQLEYIQKLKELAQTTIQKYPFMEKFFQDGIKRLEDNYNRRIS
jgi:hypothetical protein